MVHFVFSGSCGFIDSKLLGGFLKVAFHARFLGVRHAFLPHTSTWEDTLGAKEKRGKRELAVMF